MCPTSQRKHGVLGWLVLNVKLTEFRLTWEKRFLQKIVLSALVEVRRPAHCGREQTIARVLDCVIEEISQACTHCSLLPDCGII